MSRARTPSRGLFAPEVVQTSKLDCGPAALKCLCDGFGVHVSYGRLREACQTDVDGTSIDVIEEVARRLGLDAEQSVVPLDHVLMHESALLPAMVVITAGRVAHFVVVWRRFGPLVQIMDPAHGRRWLPASTLVRELWRHSMAVPAEDLRQWLGSDAFLAPLRRRLADLGLPRAAIDALVSDGLADPTVRALSGLDAATRTLGGLVRSGAIDGGGQLEAILRGLAAADRDDALVPEHDWSMWPSPDDEGQAMLRGAIVLQVRGRLSEAEPRDDATMDEATDVSALRGDDRSPWRTLGRLVARGGVGVLLASFAALVISVAAVAIQALVLRGFIDLARWLSSGGQRIAAVTAMVALLAAVAIVAAGANAGLLRAGRRLELDLRLALFRKIPRIHDQYFASRTISDVAERAQSIATIRTLPMLVFRMLGGLFDVVFTVLGLAWVAPWGRGVVPCVVACALVVGWLAHPWLVEYDRRARAHGGALAGFHLEALLGARPLAAHGAHARLMAAHEGVVVRWAGAQLLTQRVAVAVDAIQAAIGFALAWWLVAGAGEVSGHAGEALLIAYWALRLPASGRLLATMARGLPGTLNATERLLEPLHSPEEHAAQGVADPPAQPAGAASIRLCDVTVRMGGHTVLDAIDLDIVAGSHVALVGASGSGKSTLLGLLLGWHRPADGEVQVDGVALAGDVLARLRRHTAWIDPAVQLWNQSLLANLSYRVGEHAAPTELARELGAAVERADLGPLLHRLPQGLQTPLGENGRLLSGGEGQRVRFARALVGPAPRLVLLDEPFRGLDAQQRRASLARARSQWSDATLLCATHDVHETLGFPRVLVMAGGRVVEDGIPSALAADPDSRYAALLAAERALATAAWGDARWRRVRVEAGGVHDDTRVHEDTREHHGARGRTVHITPLPRNLGGQLARP